MVKQSPEVRVSNLEDVVHPLHGEMEGLKIKLLAQEKHITDLAHRNKRNNTRIPKKSEGLNPFNFMFDWLLETRRPLYIFLKKDRKQCAMVLE